jgi:hypothetical protein
MQAWRSVQRQSGSAAGPVQPPPIDPGEHTIHTQHWGDLAHHVVLHQGRYYAWLTDASAGGRATVRRVPSEKAGRQLVDEWQADNILHIAWNETIAHIILMDPGEDSLIGYEATLAEVENRGLWLACRDQTVAGQTSYTLERFTEVEPALAAFADQADLAADQAEQNQTLTMPDVLAGVLRYRAATTWTEITRARLGDALRAHRSQAAGGGLSPALHGTGLDREGLGPVLAGQEFTWPTGPAVRPPGSRRPDTSVTRLAVYTVAGQAFTLQCSVDSAGAHCVGVEYDGHSAQVKDVEVDEYNLVNQGSMLPSRQGSAAVIYGRAHDSVTELYSLSADGQRTNWPIYDDPSTGERYFAVVVVPETAADIVAGAPRSSTSLRRFFGMWFNPPGRRPRYEE